MGTGTTLNNYDQLTVGVHKVYLKVTDGAVSKESYITVTITAKEAEVIPTASLISPSNGTTLDSTDPVTLKWNSTHELASSFTYEIYIGTSIVPRNLPAVKEGHASMSYEYSGLEDGKTYYWQVVPIYGTIEGPPSQIYNFKVEVTYIRPQPTCTLASPTNDTTVTTLSVEFEWASTHDNKADFTYDLYWGTSRFNLKSLPSPNAADLTGLKYTATGLSDETRYYWTVIPVDLDDERGICTSDPPIWEFYVDTEGGKTDVTVNLKEPGDGKIHTEATVVLKWASTDSAASNYKYKVYIGTDSNPVKSAPIASGIAATEYTFSVEDDTTYYWTVIPSYNGDGVCLDGVWSFDVDFDFVEKRELDVTGGLDVNLDAGKTQTVTLTVKNTGNVEETIDVTVDSGGLSGITASPSSVTVAPDSQQTITVDIVIPEDADAKTYTVTVKFTPAGETTPLAEETFQVKVNKEEEGEESNALLYGIIVVIIVVVVLVVVMLMMRGKKKGGEAPEAEGEVPMQEAPPAAEPGPGEQPAAGPAPAPAVPGPAPEPAPEPAPGPEPQAPEAAPEAGEAAPEPETETPQ
jgi:hypothetical protein